MVLRSTAIITTVAFLVLSPVLRASADVPRTAEGWLAVAESANEQVTSPGLKAWGMIDVARVQVQSGNRAHALALLVKVVNLIPTVPANERANIANEVIALRAKAGDFVGASAAVELVPTPQRRDAIRTLATSAARAGRSTEAMTAAQQETDVRIRRSLQATVCGLLAESNGEAALALAAALDTPATKVYAHARIGEARSRAGDANGAAAAFQKARDELANTPEADRDRAATSLATMRGRAGDWTGARAIADGVSDQSRRALAYASVHAEACARGAIGEAGTLATLALTTIGNNDEDQRVLRKLAGNEGLYGNEACLGRVDSIKDALDRASNLRAMGEWASRRGEQGAAAERLARAAKAASEVEPPSMRSAVTVGIASAHARSGDFKAAAETAATLTEPASRGRELANRTEALARAGRKQEAQELWATAFRVADAVADAEQRAAVLASLVRAAVVMGELKDGRRAAMAVPPGRTRFALMMELTEEACDRFSLDDTREWLQETAPADLTAVALGGALRALRSPPE